MNTTETSLNLLPLFLCNTPAQDYTKLGLPDGAKARLGKGKINDATYSPDGTRLAVASSIGIWIYDTATLKEVALLPGHLDDVESIAFSPDGRLLASGGAHWDGTVRLWDAETGEHLRTLIGDTLGGTVSSVAFSPNGHTLASGGLFMTVHLWDATTGEHLRRFGGHTAPVECVAFSPDGSTLASGSEDATVRLRDVKSRKNLQMLTGHTDSVRSIVFSPDGSELTSVGGYSEPEVQLWDAKSGENLHTLTGHTRTVRSISFSSDDTDITWTDSVGDAWMVSSIFFSSDGRSLAIGYDDGTVPYWETETGENQRTLAAHPDRGRSVTLSPDGRLLASGERWGDKVRLWVPIQGNICAGSPGIPGGSRAQRSVRMAGRLPVGAGTKQCDSGMPKRGNICEHSLGILSLSRA